MKETVFFVIGTVLVIVGFAFALYHAQEAATERRGKCLSMCADSHPVIECVEVCK